MLRWAVSIIDRLNDRIGGAIKWLALIMVLVGAFNAVARYADRYTGISLSSNAYLDLQWYLFSLIFLLAAFVLNLNPPYGFSFSEGNAYGIRLGAGTVF